MSQLRERVQQITNEYWKARQTQSERVAVARFMLAFAQAELDAEEGRLLITQKENNG